MENTMDLGWIVDSGLMGLFFVDRWLQRGREDKLLNRIMAKNYEEFKYYEDKYPEDIKTLKMAMHANPASE